MSIFYKDLYNFAKSWGLVLGTPGSLPIFSLVEWMIYKNHVWLPTN